MRSRAAAIKRQIDAGTYEVRPDLVAAAMVRRGEAILDGRLAENDHRARNARRQSGRARAARANRRRMAAAT